MFSRCAGLCPALCRLDSVTGIRVRQGKCRRAHRIPRCGFPALLLTRLSREIDEPISQWEYPEVKNVALWYAILDESSWTTSPQRWDWVVRGLRWWLDMHRPLRGELGYTASRLFLVVDLAVDLMRYRPTLFIAATRDPVGLLSSTRLAHGMLVGLCETLVQEYDATHGFVAYRPQVQALFGAPWETTAVPATQATIHWIKGEYGTAKGMHLGVERAPGEQSTLGLLAHCCWARHH